MNLRRIRRFAATLILPIGLAVAACQPTTPIPLPATPTGANLAAPLVVGDSITWQAAMSGGFSGTGYRNHTAMGWKMSTPEVQDRIKQERAAGTLDTLVIALGTNDANTTWNGGWTADDRNLWASTILNLHADTKLVLVLPYVCETALPAHVAEVNEARVDIASLGATRPNTSVVDWKDYAILSSDCIHLPAVDPTTSLPATPESVQARMQVIADGLAAVTA